MVPRPRLIEQLDAGLRSGRKLTLISAPAGFGKTTLLSEWAADYDQLEPEGRVAWLPLDRGDDDLARFLAYFVAALPMIPSLSEAGVRESALAMLHAAQSQSLPVEAILTALINESATIPTAFSITCPQCASWCTEDPECSASRHTLGLLFTSPLDSPYLSMARRPRQPLAR